MKISQKYLPFLPFSLGFSAALTTIAVTFYRGIESISVGDGFDYLRQAKGILRGWGYILSNPNDFSHGLIFSATIAVTFLISGSTSLLLFKIILALFHGISTYLLVRVAQAIGGTTSSSVVVAIAFALDPFLIFAATDIQTESITTFIVIYWAYVYVIPNGDSKYFRWHPFFWMLSGVYGILMRPNFLLPFLGVGIMLILKWRKDIEDKRILYSAILIFAMVMAVDEAFLYILNSGFVFLAGYGGFGAAYLCRPEFIPQYLGYASSVVNAKINDWVNVDNPLTRLAISRLSSPTPSGINSELYRIGISTCLSHPLESVWLILLRMFSVWRPFTVFGAYGSGIFLTSLVLWLPMTLFSIWFLTSRTRTQSQKLLRNYFIVMSSAFTFSLLFTFPQVRHRVAFAEPFYWLFAILFFQSLMKEMNQHRRTGEQLTT